MQLEAAARVRLFVVDERGDRVSGAQVYWRARDGRLLSARALPEEGTDEQGTSVVGSLPLGPGSIVAKHFDRGQGETAVDLLAGIEVEAKIRLRSLTDVSLQLIGDSGEPAEPMVLRWIRDETGSLEPIPHQQQSAREGFHIGQLPSGRQTVGFWRPWGALYVHELDVPESSARVSLAVRVER